MIRHLRAGASCAVLFAALTASATDIHIETRVYAADAETPTTESVTLFHGGAVYDIRENEGWVTIYRPGAGGKSGRFILLDRGREIRTEIDTAQVTALMVKLRRWAGSQEDAFLRFTGAPTFTESYTPATGELTLASDQLTYKITTTPVANSEAMAQLRDFLDRFAELHAMLEAGLPPEPRLRVNAALAKRQVAPVKIELSAGDDKPSLRAEYVVAWIVSKQDQLRIDAAQEQMTRFREVSNIEFQKGRLAAK